MRTIILLSTLLSMNAQLIAKPIDFKGEINPLEFSFSTN